MMLPLDIVKYTNEVWNQDLHDLFIETLFWINLCLEKIYFKLQIQVESK